MFLLTFTITERIPVSAISVTVSEVFLSICIISVAFNILLREERVNLSTKLDFWNIILVILFLKAGIFSYSARGLLGSFKAIEGIAAFYLAIYFIRTNKFNITKFLKTLFLITMIQALIGIFQSFTGIGSQFQGSRNILGYLGIGSKFSWHGFGAFNHFNKLGNFLIQISLFFLPFYYYLVKNKQKCFLIIIILLTAIYTTYSRGSWLAFYFGGLFFLSIVNKNKIRLSLVFIASLILVFIAYNFYTNTDYTINLDSRFVTWKIVLSAMENNINHVLYGVGFNAFDDIIFPYFGELKTKMAHNYFLQLYAEMGIIGAGIISAFWVKIMLDIFKRFKNSIDKFSKSLNLGALLYVYTVFWVSIFQHNYHAPVLKILLFTILALIYSTHSGKSDDKQNCYTYK